MFKASFNFGEGGAQEMKIIAGVFGRERYFIDGRLVMDRISCLPSGRREFIVDQKKLEIVLKAGIFRMSSQAFFNGERVAVQDIQQLWWNDAQVNQRLEELMLKSFAQVRTLSKTRRSAVGTSSQSPDS